MSGPSSNERERLVASVHGVVQGVGFRWFTQREATRLGLTGWVANQADGSVGIVAEGSADVLRALVAVLRHGPDAASVREVIAHYEPARGNLTGFEIRSGAHRGD